MYGLGQIVGCYAGMLLSHAMFDLPQYEGSTHIRTGLGQWIAEAVATAGLIGVVVGYRQASDAPWTVAACIGAPSWFTASISFANPAITIARSLSDTFAGIRPGDVPAFIGAQFVGALGGREIERGLFASTWRKSLNDGHFLDLR